MIERWLQFTCDRCDETCYSTMPNMTAAEFRKEERIVRRDGRDLCRSCAAWERDNQSPSPERKVSEDE